MTLGIALPDIQKIVIFKDYKVGPHCCRAWNFHHDCSAEQVQHLYSWGEARSQGHVLHLVASNLRPEPSKSFLG